VYSRRPVESLSAPSVANSFHGTTASPSPRAATKPGEVQSRPTFPGALALVRRELWDHQGFAPSARDPDIVKLPRQFVERLTETLAYAA